MRGFGGRLTLFDLIRFALWMPPYRDFNLGSVATGRCTGKRRLAATVHASSGVPGLTFPTRPLASMTAVSISSRTSTVARVGLEQTGHSTSVRPSHPQLSQARPGVFE